MTDYLAGIELRLKIRGMGTIHKFKRPPKNENQFKGFRPLGSAGPVRRPGLWRRLHSWQRSLIAWVLLVAVAAGIVGVRALIAATG